MGKKIGLILGRFAPLHIGHEYLINYALSKCDLLLIFVGSANNNSFHNPFSYKTRELMIKSVFKDRVIVYSLNDLGVGNVNAWGDYLISSALKIVPKIDIYFYGEEEKCNLWFNDEIKKTIKFESVDRNFINIHGTDLRKFIRENDEESFKKYTSKSIHFLYDTLKKEAEKFKR